MNRQDEPEDNTGYKDNMFDRVMAGGDLYYTGDHGLINVSLVSVFNNVMEHGTARQVDVLIKASCNTVWGGKLPLINAMTFFVSLMIDENFDAIDEYEKEESRRAQHDC